MTFIKIDYTLLELVVTGSAGRTALHLSSATNQHIPLIILQSIHILPLHLHIECKWNDLIVLSGYFHLLYCHHNGSLYPERDFLTICLFPQHV